MSTPTISARWRSLLGSSVPGRLRQLTVLAAVLGLLAATAGYATYASRASALRDAQSSTAQLVLLQSIRTNLVSADATATNAFLVGGLEPQGARAEYLSALDAASRQLSQAAGQSRDAATAAALSSVASSVTRYAGLVEAARANNRQGYPVGAGYLKSASAGLRTGALAGLGALSQKDESEVGAALARGGSAPLLWLLAGIVVVLGFGQRWLTRVTRRMVNLGMATATALLVVCIVGSYAVFAWTAAALDEATRTSYAATVDLSRARIDAFDARANESLTLISRGSGQAYQAAYAAALARARDAAARQVGDGGATLDALTAWDAVHQQIRALDDKGQWDQAVALATGQAAAGGSPQAFAGFDKVSAQALDDAARTADSTFTQPLTVLGLGGLLAALAGVACAVAVWRGLAPRIGEYA